MESLGREILQDLQQGYAFAERFMSRASCCLGEEEVLQAYGLLGDLHAKGFTLSSGSLEGKGGKFPAFNQVSFLNIQQLDLVEYLQSVLELEERSERVKRISSVEVACFASRVFASAQGFSFSEQVEDRVKRQLTVLFEDGWKVSSINSTVGAGKSWPVFTLENPR